MRSLRIRLWAALKIAYFSLCFVVGIAIVVISLAVMGLSVGRLLLPRS